MSIFQLMWTEALSLVLLLHCKLKTAVLSLGWGRCVWTGWVWGFQSELAVILGVKSPYE